MNRAQVHRGPDDEGTFVSPAGVALGARRLSILDVEGGHQPVSNEDGSVWSVLNGEVYNYPALRRSLERSGHRLRSGVDTEVLVHLYEDYGPELVHALEGMYAFAIWDERRGHLLLGRDRFGEKPLFYAETHNDLRFASELTALLAGGCDPQLDPAAVDEFFLFGYVNAPGSFVRGVRQLPPGCSLVWDRAAGCSTPRRYWRRPLPDSGSATMRELTAEADELFARATRSRLLSDVPVGVFLSGGTDSTLIAALIAGQDGGEAMRSFTVGYEHGAGDERSKAAAAAKAVGSHHVEHVLLDREVAELAPELFRRIDQPIADRALLAMHSLARVARREVKVIVGGEGADEFFGGYGRYRWLARGERLPRRLTGRMAPVERALRRSGSSRADHVADLLDAGDPQLHHLNWSTEQRLRSRSLIYGERLRALPAEHWYSSRWLAEQAVATAAMHDDTERWLPGDVLPKADRAGMLASLELRTPFLSREVTEFASRLPPELHLRKGGKAILRALLERHAPSVARLPKTGFQVPAAEWLRGPLAAEMERQLDSGRAYAEGWLSVDRVRGVWNEHRQGRRDWTALLWPALTFELWLEGIESRPGGR